MSDAYGRFRGRLLIEVLEHGLTPEQVAARLEAEGLGRACADEILQYKAWGDRWGGALGDCVVDNPGSALVPRKSPVGS